MCLILTCLFNCKDEIIPPGLHVRMNLQTGLREAKLLEQAKDVHAAKGEII